MPLSDDPWIAANSPIPPESLHALGYIHFRWNACEMAALSLYHLFTGSRFVETWEIAQDKRFSDMAGEIKKAVSASKNTGDEKECVLYALKLLDVCRLNRNQLAHFVISATPSG